VRPEKKPAGADPRHGEPGDTRLDDDLGIVEAPVDTAITPLGALLVERGDMSGQQLRDALGAQTSGGKRLGEILVELGVISERVLSSALAEQVGLEAVDIENLRPHYAKTLWAWSDALEAQLGAARALTSETTLRAYRLYLAGSAMAFERAWISLHQMLCARRSGDVASGPMTGAQSAFPFNRSYMYPAA